MVLALHKMQYAYDTILSPKLTFHVTTQMITYNDTVSSLSALSDTTKSPTNSVVVSDMSFIPFVLFDHLLELQTAAED